jgi:hypothetical protein
MSDLQKAAWLSVISGGGMALLSILIVMGFSTQLRELSEGDPKSEEVIVSTDSTVESPGNAASSHEAQVPISLESNEVAPVVHSESELKTIKKGNVLPPNLLAIQGGLSKAIEGFALGVASGIRTGFLLIVLPFSLVVAGLGLVLSRGGHWAKIPIGVLHAVVLIYIIGIGTADWFDGLTIFPVNLQVFASAAALFFVVKGWRESDRSSVEEIPA